MPAWLKAWIGSLDTGGRILAAVLLAATGLGSWWWLSEQRADAPDEERPRQPDSYFRQLDAVRHDDAGNPDMRVKARYAEHYEDDNWIHLHDFSAHGLGTESSPWRITARRGRLSDDGVELEAWQDVVMLRDANGASSLQLETEALSVNTETKLAVTEELVVISRGGSRITGRGMRASLQDDHLRLEHDVEARYEK